MNLLKRHKIQPTASADVGMMYSSRAIPIDTGTRFNFLFSFGPGVEVFSSPRHSVRLEYLFRHISNANTGKENPGIDGGVWRLTFSLHK